MDNLIANNMVPHHDLLLHKSNDLSKFLDSLWLPEICKTPLQITIFSLVQRVSLHPDLKILYPELDLPSISTETFFTSLISG